MDCALCDKFISAEIDSEEHLILNAIGGRRKVPGILCITCNSTAGDEWDSELANQLNSLSLLFNIKRQRGKAPALKVETTAGEKLKLHHDGSLSLAEPTYLAIPGEGTTQIKIVARSKAEAKIMLTGAKKKYPSIDVDATLAAAEEQFTYPTGAINFPLIIGGTQGGRSLVKSALCFAASNGVDPRACTNARNYLRSQTAEPCFGYYYARDLLQSRPAQVPLHCVAVSNKGTDGQLLGYVEFFGFHRAVICLADAYSGPDIHCAYAIDPVSGIELKIDFELRLSREELAATYAYERIPDGAMVQAFNTVFAEAHKKSFEREKDRAISEAVRYAFKNCGAAQGDILTSDHLKKFSGLMAQKMMPFLMRFAANRHRQVPAGLGERSE